MFGLYMQDRNSSTLDGAALSVDIYLPTGPFIECLTMLLQLLCCLRDS